MCFFPVLGLLSSTSPVKITEAHVKCKILGRGLYTDIFNQHNSGNLKIVCYEIPCIHTTIDKYNETILIILSNKTVASAIRCPQLHRNNFRCFFLVRQFLERGLLSNASPSTHSMWSSEINPPHSKEWDSNYDWRRHALLVVILKYEIQILNLCLGSSTCGGELS